MNKNEVKIICVGFINIEDIQYPNMDTMFNVPGGAALYSACAAKIWKSNVMLVSAVGKNFPGKIKNILTEKGLELKLVEHEIDTMCGSTRYYSDGSREYKMFTSIEDRITLTPRVFEFENSLNLTNDKFCVHLSTFPPVFQIEWANFFRSNGANLISFDTDISFVSNNRGQIEELLSLTDICFMNHDEASSFISETNDISEIAEQISVFGSSLIVIKKGEKGAYIYDRNNQKHVEVQAFSTDVVDVTGAGDTFAGTFLSLLSDGESLESAGRLAAATASSCIEEYGSLHLLERTKEEITKKYFIDGDFNNDK